jgi:tRNA pseudouridine55 synthase
MTLRRVFWSSSRAASVVAKPANFHGFVSVDKPHGMTSHDVVGRLRRVFGQRQVGHAGTLDPDATGVLVVGLGNATRLLRFVSESHKSYIGEVVLGSTTHTLDDSGVVTGQWDMSATTLEELRAAAVSLTGEIDQIPPMVSAVQVDGRRLHELARKGVEIERKSRRVRVDRIDVVDWAAPGVVSIEVDCGSGTYIRSLADDLGRLVGGGAHLRNLRRTRVGSFGVADSIALDDVTDASVVPPEQVIGSLQQQIAIDGSLRQRVVNGQRLSSDLFAGLDVDQPVVLLNNNVLVGVFEHSACVVMPYDSVGS